MKKVGLILTILIIILIIISLFLFIRIKTKDKMDLEKERINQEKINQIIQSEINSYCEDMNIIAEEKPWDICGACFTTNMTNSYHSISYNLTQVKDIYNITIKVRVIFNGRNDQSGMGTINLILDKERNLLTSINSAEQGIGCMGFPIPGELKKLKEDECVNETDKDNCYFDIAVNKKNSSLCVRVLDSLKLDRCYYNIGILNFNLESCNKISESSNLKAKCIAQVKKDPELCLQLSEGQSDQSSCISFIAEKTGNITICDMITYSDIDKTICYSLTNNPE
jgi:hypothetical protein